MFKDFDDRARLVFFYAKEEAKRQKHRQIDSEHVLHGLMREGGFVARILSRYITKEMIEHVLENKEKQISSQQDIAYSKEVMSIQHQSWKEADNKSIKPKHILLALLHEENSALNFLKEMADVEEIESIISTQERREEALTEKVKSFFVFHSDDDQTIGKFSLDKQDSNKKDKSVLGRYGYDVTKEAKAGKLDPLIGRDTELERIIQILSRRTKNNIILIGEAGVGKTALVEGLAQMMINVDPSHPLYKKKIISLNINELLAGTRYRGEFEERMKKIIAEIKDKETIVFIDEIHTIIGAGGSEGKLDAANILKPALARGEIQMIGATTHQEYRVIENDTALERRFQPLFVKEPSPKQTFDIIKGLQSRYEDFHQIKITDSIIEFAIATAEKDLPMRHFPDKALDLIDEAASRAKFRSSTEKIITRDDIIHVSSSLSGGQRTYYMHDLEEKLAQKVYGQSEAIKAVSDALKRAHIGLGGHNRVLASFLFVGSSGLGKTHLAKSLAQILFETEDALIRLDMSEYSESHSISKLIGSPPGYVGHETEGKLSAQIRKRPFSILLLDEIEKAHPDIYNLFLQIIDDGRLTDNKGRVIDFKRTLIIMTSNVGFNTTSTAGFSPVLSDGKVALKNTFPPEFLDRMDDIIRFQPLKDKHMTLIMQQLLDNLCSALQLRGYSINIDPSVAPWLISQHEGNMHHAVGSSRQLRILVRKHIEDPLTSLLMNNPEQSQVQISMVQHQIHFRTSAS